AARISAGPVPCSVRATQGDGGCIALRVGAWTLRARVLKRAGNSRTRRVVDDAVAIVVQSVAVLVSLRKRVGHAPEVLASPIAIIVSGLAPCRSACRTVR